MGSVARPCEFVKGSIGALATLPHTGLHVSVVRLGTEQDLVGGEIEFWWASGTAAISASV